jgi:branched-chain amino acid transport system ATP-binding protein
MRGRIEEGKPMAERPLLELHGVETFYGASQALFGVDLAIEPGEFATLMGRNGMGKTTTVHSIMGLTPIAAGRILFKGEEIHGLEPHRIARAGIGLAPEGRQVFPTLSVRENLEATGANRFARERPWILERIYAMFPELEARDKNLGSQLSGGEQQMLAIGRALMTNPELLILDEATEGLAPLVRQEIWACLERLKDEGLAILVIDKNVNDLMRVADRHFIIEKGRIGWAGDSAALAADTTILDRYMGVSGG